MQLTVVWQNAVTGPCMDYYDVSESSDPVY